jgi:pimeloyl-ACP methyl ester carboxylesterase
MNPVQVWDPSIPMNQDRRYDNWWEFPRKLFQRGPGTTSYETSRYKPAGKGDYIIAFGGAGSGVGGWSDEDYLAKQYGGEGNIARFTWNQLPEAIAYAKSLQKGSRLFVWGHSMGGTAAMRFAKELEKLGTGIAGMDLRDPVRIDGRLSALRSKILSVLPGKDYPRATPPKNVTVGSTYYNGGWIPRDIPDLAALAGQAWNQFKDAPNWRNIQMAPQRQGHIQANRDNLKSRYPDVKEMRESIRKNAVPPSEEDNTITKK